MIRDISVAVGPATPEWPGDVPFQCGWTARIAEGASVNLSSVTSSPHVGTHADAPLHVRDGWPATESLPLDAFLGAVFVLDVRDAPSGVLTLGADDRRLHGVERLLLRTGRSIAGGSFPEEWPVLGAPTASALAARGLRLVGVDAPSVDERESRSLPVHHALFAGGAYVLENLDLRDVAEGRYELVALPQRLVGLDAAPVRAALIAPEPPQGR
ncbi:MAG TPA: cyclase family protein [Gemmatimonadaceae bacterium]|jgi:arylformamidase|nr:cyclase family protein [Gemmatimonadaceae bacterium]